MLNLQCRLCSSSTALISLFSGKCRKNRDYIRKLTEITTGIKFQKSDVCTCICFGCTVQIYNFYIFRVQSIENELKLQVCTKGSEGVKSHKIEVTELDDIVLPGIEELKENLSSWFISKQKYCETGNNEADINKIGDVAGNHENSTQERTLVESGTQYDLVDHTEIGIQHEPDSSEIGTQTNKLATRTKKTQCGKLDFGPGNENKEIATQTSEADGNYCFTKKIDKSSQYECFNVEMCTQTEIPKGESKDCSTETETCLENKIESSNKETQCDECIFERQRKPNRIVPKTVKTHTKSAKRDNELSRSNITTYNADITDNCFKMKLNDKCRCDLPKIEVDTQTNEITAKSVETQCELLKTNKNSAKPKFSPVEARISNSEESLYQETQAQISKINQGTPNNESEGSSKQIDTDSRENIGVEGTSKETKRNLRFGQRSATRLISNTFKTQSKLSKSNKKSTNCTETALQAESVCIGNNTEGLHINGHLDLSQGQLLNKNKDKGDDELEESLTQPLIKSKDDIHVISFSKKNQCDLYPIQKNTKRRSLTSNATKIRGRLPTRNSKKLKMQCKKSIMQPESLVNAIQCQTLSPINPEILKYQNKDSYTQTDVESKIGIERFSKEIQCDLYVFSGYETRRSLTPNSIKIQGRLSKRNKEKLALKCTESTTQTELSCLGIDTEGLQAKIFRKLDISKTLNLDIKYEIETPPALSPAKCLSINVDGAKSEALISPGLGYASPRSSSLLTIKDKIQRVIICPECDKTVYSNSEYKLHKKSHLKCNFCKKKFRSLEKTKLHVEFQCNIQKLTKTVPVVMLIRLENVTDIQNKYPECLEFLQKFHEPYSEENSDEKQVMRIRSRSVSDMDSVINCTACKGYISVLNGVSMGVDKSVQVNFIFDKDLITPLEFIFKNVCSKRNLEDSVNKDGGPLKKLKISPVSS